MWYLLCSWWWLEEYVVVLCMHIGMGGSEAITWPQWSLHRLKTGGYRGVYGGIYAFGGGICCWPNIVVSVVFLQKWR